jgi:hypothetical protein
VEVDERGLREERGVEVAKPQAHPKRACQGAGATGERVQ